MKEVLIFGSTGSIGRKVLEFIRKNKKSFKIKGLCVKKNIKILKRQIEEFRPKYVCIFDEKIAKKYRESFPKYVKIFFGEKGLEEFSKVDSHISVMSIPGIDSLKPLLMNLKHTKRILLASKEPIVVAGSLIKKEAKKNGVEILPLDSEINALFQLLQGKRKNSLSKVYLTATGGVVQKLPIRRIKNLTPQEVLSHPVWKMGKKITVDSSTLINKGFEVVEAHHFFDLEYKDIDALIHPQAYIHAVIEFVDGIKFLSFHYPDMMVPIAYSFCYPERMNSNIDKSFFKDISLSFQPIERKRFPLFYLVKEAAQREDNSLIVINAFDEIAVEYFLKGKIKFLDIQKAIEYGVLCSPGKRVNSFEEVFFWDRWARKKAKEFLPKLVK